MVSPTALAVAAVLILFCLLKAIGLKRNIREARQIGLPYIIVPFNLVSISWALLSLLLLPVFKRLPEQWTTPWLPILQFTRGWHYAYMPFDVVGADTFIAVSPDGNIVHTCDPTASDMVLRNPSLGKPRELLEILNIFGPTMTGTDGPDSRLYRKTTAPFFNEQTMRGLWGKAMENTGALLEVLSTLQSGRDWAERDSLRKVFARLTLHVLNSTSLEGGRDGELIEILQDKDTPPQGHRLTYSKAMHTMLDHFGTVFTTPRVVLDHSPLQAHQKARQAFDELYAYIKEGIVSKEANLQEKELLPTVQSPSILELLVRAGLPKPGALLNPAEVEGNVFIFMFAGHEANANTLTFLFLLLACHPAVQKHMQIDIDRITAEKLGAEETRNRRSSLRSTSAYDSCYTALMKSHIGAAINEALRLYSVIPFLVKTVPATQVAPGGYELQAEGQSYILPPKAAVFINTTAMHCHPKLWPDNPQKNAHRMCTCDELAYKHKDQPRHRTNPVDCFNPSRWFSNPTAFIYDGPAEREPLLKPRPGSFIPFSDGHRGCLGKQFGLVELCAVTTRILSEYSVELVVDEGEQGSKQSVREDYSEIWRAAREKARRALMKDVKFDMSLRMVGKIPLRFVERGAEQGRSR